MPEPDMIRLLCEVFVTRCQGPLSNIVHTPTFMKQVEMLCACLNLASPEAQIMAVSSTISMDRLACHLLAVRMLPLYRVSSVCLRSLFQTARARSRVPSHTFSTRLVAYTSGISCRRASSVRCIFQDVEITCFALPPRKGVALLWLDCHFTSCYYAFARWSRGIVSARCNLGHCNCWGPETWITWIR